MKQAILTFDKTEILIREPEPDHLWLMENVRPNIITSDGKEWECIGNLSELSEAMIPEVFLKDLVSVAFETGYDFANTWVFTIKQ